MKIKELLEAKSQKADAPKPRNFVAKNSKMGMGGAGAHRDKKKAEKQGDVKHKGKQFDEGVAEGSEFGAYYYEKVAQEIFDKRQDISSEDEVLNQAYKIVSNEQGQKSARYMFNYDEDFPSDVVSAYFWLQKQQGKGVAEGPDDSLPGRSKLSGATAAPAPNPALKNILMRHMDEVRSFVKYGEIDSTGDLFYELYEYFANEIPEPVRRDPRRLERRIGNMIAPYAKFYADQKLMNGQGVAEGRHGYDDAGFSLAPGHDEGEPVYNPRYDRTGQYDRKAKYSQDYNYNTGKPLGAPQPAKKGFIFYNVKDPLTAQKMGLKQTKSGKWYLPTGSTFLQKQADKVFGTGRIWYPKESVDESATAGSTSAGNVSVGVVYPNKKGKTFKNKDGTTKNALDATGNLLTGGSIAKR